MEEKFDVLLENGEFSGKVETRSKCHKLGLWHKAVALFIINSQNEVLLQKRSASKKMWPNLWDISAGGHVLAGEFGFEAIIREIKEELGSNINKNDILFLGASTSQNIKGEIINKHFNEYYIVNKDIDISKLILQEEEVSEVKWFKKDDVIRRINDNYDGITDKEGCWEYLKKYYEWIDKK
ncbi:MAG TPA: NUDIX domain-containing protein [Candidatus Scatovivens faecipullorum]|nr:NUDIX domain-containing protein [Candidatus Scatovivens faecipullorum]